jgi:hypothetical protein
LRLSADSAPDRKELLTSRDYRQDDKESRC